MLFTYARQDLRAYASRTGITTNHTAVVTSLVSDQTSHMILDLIYSPRSTTTATTAVDRSHGQKQGLHGGNPCTPRRTKSYS